MLLETRATAKFWDGIENELEELERSVAEVTNRDLWQTFSASPFLRVSFFLSHSSLTVDLHYSRADEAFRAEVRAWLEVEVPAQARVPLAARVGAENDGWRIANVTLRFERGTAFAPHIITMRSQVLRLASLAKSRRGPRAPAVDDCRRRIGRLYASVEALWRMTQMCIAEAERTGAPSPLGSAIKLRHSELSQEISELAVRVVGRPIIGAAELDGARTGEIAREYLWSLQATIAAGTSQIQRNLIAERILGMPKVR